MEINFQHGRNRRYKMMGIVRNTLHGYFSKNALPYYGILAIDAMTIVFLNMYGFYWQFGGNAVASVFWTLLLGCVVMVIPFLIGFRIFHTYNGIIRFSTFADLTRVGYAMLLGCLLAGIVSLISPDDDWLITPNCTTLTIVLVAGTTLMWGWRDSPCCR